MFGKRKLSDEREGGSIALHLTVHQQPSTALDSPQQSTEQAKPSQSPLAARRPNLGKIVDKILWSLIFFWERNDDVTDS